MAHECPEFDFDERTQLGEPTDAPPGSFEKFAILKERAEAGLALWHPDDRCDYRAMYCGPGASEGYSLKLLRPPAKAKPRRKDKSGTSVTVGGKHLAE